MSIYSITYLLNNFFLYTFINYIIFSNVPYHQLVFSRKSLLPSLSSHLNLDLYIYQFKTFIKFELLSTKVSDISHSISE